MALFFFFYNVRPSSKLHSASSTTTSQTREIENSALTFKHTFDAARPALAETYTDPAVDIDIVRVVPRGEVKPSRFGAKLTSRLSHFGPLTLLPAVHTCAAAAHLFMGTSN